MSSKKKKKRLTLKKKAEIEEKQKRSKNKIQLMAILAGVLGLLGGLSIVLAIIFS